MAELDEPFNKLKAVLQDIISRVETDDDDSDFQHYTKYLNDLIFELDEAKQFITSALEAVGEQPKTNSIVAPSDSSSKSDDGGGSSSNPRPPFAGRRLATGHESGQRLGPPGHRKEGHGHHSRRTR